MPPAIHGTRDDPGRLHAVFDLLHWETEFPLGNDRREGASIDDPAGLARREQACRLAKSKGDLGSSIPADVFVWADAPNHDRPWLTRIGGRPWRGKTKPWPRGANDIPLAFLGQICFADSRDICTGDLPGDVALIFGSFSCGGVSLVDGSALEWSSLKLGDSLGDIPWNGQLPYEFQGVIHRTVQYTSREAAEPAFKAAGYKEGGWGIHSIQATSIGAYANLPQGWPFQANDGNTLIATLSAFSFTGKWPLCDVPAAPKAVRADGSETDLWNDQTLSFGIGDAGAIWIYRDKHGNFKLDDACG